MQIKIFTIPVVGGEMLEKELNVFLRSRKILSVEQKNCQDGQTACWSFCVKYLDDRAFVEREQQKTDYRDLLDEDTFARFANLREVRKNLAQAAQKPAYVFFTDAELAKLAELDPLTLEGMQGIKGIGERKIEKYGAYFINATKGEKG